MSETILVQSTTIEPKILASCKLLIAAFFSNSKIEVGMPLTIQEAEVNILCIERNADLLPVIQISFLVKPEPHVEDQQETALNPQETRCTIDSESLRGLEQQPLPGKEPLTQLVVKRALFIFLAAYTNKRIPWGILTGIRPGKLWERLQNQEQEQTVQDQILTELYQIDPAKQQLLHTVAQIQEPYLQEMETDSKRISVYVMIPFCPSRCIYCSFPSNILETNHRDNALAYLKALYQELELTGELMKQKSLTADTIYIGGGTPTTLSESELEMLLQKITQHIPTEPRFEYTVEAGRADTINQAKLRLMKAFGVNRISINPQTMQDRTLNKIGRKHTVAQVVDCYQMAREISDWVINMDLIVGLPLEGYDEIIDSLKQLLALRPDNLTVHALALKRGSEAWDHKYNLSEEKNWFQLSNEIQNKMIESGYQPYYLYRQKNSVGNLENVGYTLQGKVCRYNIAMIEEKQMIIGLGAAASSKIPIGESRHLNLYQPINLAHYIHHFRDIHLKRKEIML